MEDNKTFLGTEPVGKLLFKLAVPTIVAQIINMLYNIVDRIFIGHIPQVGSLAMTGVGVCLPIIMVVSAFAAFVSAGGAPRASIAMGKKDFHTAEKILGECFVLQFFISLILTAILLIFGGNLLLVFGASKNTIQYAADYLNVYAIGTLFVQLTLGMNAFITAQGFTKFSMLSVAIGAVVNIILDPILIYGFHMGVRGAALATIISQALSCFWVLCFLRGRKTILKIKKRNFSIHYKVILPCIALGAATFIMQASESVISVCFNSSLLRYGGDIAVGAMTILTSVMQFAMLPLQGIGQGAQPIISYNFGAKNAERVKQIYRLLLICCLTYSIVLWSAVILVPHFFVSIFTSNGALAEFSTKALRIYVAGLFLMGIQIACQMTFTSIGYATCAITVAIVRKFVLLLPLIYVMPHLVSDKTTGIYLAEPIADVIAVTFTVILFTFQFKKAIRNMR